MDNLITCSKHNYTSINGYSCPTCFQDMRDEPRNGDDCPQCGQGLGSNLLDAITRKDALLRGCIDVFIYTVKVHKSTGCFSDRSGFCKMCLLDDHIRKELSESDNKEQE